MTCWHCNDELEYNFQTTVTNSSKFYHCQGCDKWYELRKERAKVNGAVPVRIVELENSPQVGTRALAA
jgi:hypothetical protein